MLGAGNFLHERQQIFRLRWLAVLCAVAVTVGGLHLITPALGKQADQAAPTVRPGKPQQ
ncbi:hypothetical protein [Mycolicibacterium porcinum]|uniref:hypothetical protein n=1 Tax=Mycolicibacterium porcinum TaxID=39693 RepID=UPI0013F4C88C|nr:hypothetical protein [Mycolicibacterium porcinum]